VCARAQVNLEAQERALMEPRSVPAWFSCDIRLGQLAITLEPPGCFSAEEYAQVRGGRVLMGRAGKSWHGLAVWMCGRSLGVGIGWHLERCRTLSGVLVDAGWGCACHAHSKSVSNAQHASTRAWE